MRLAPPIETLPELFPLFPINAAQIGSAWRTLARGNGGDQARLATQHRGGRGGLAPGGTALVIALRAELMLKVIVGTRQIRHGVAVKQPRTITAGDLRSGRWHRSGCPHGHGDGPWPPPCR